MDIIYIVKGYDSEFDSGAWPIISFFIEKDAEDYKALLEEKLETFKSAVSELRKSYSHLAPLEYSASDFGDKYTELRQKHEFGGVSEGVEGYEIEEIEIR